MTRHSTAPQFAFDLDRIGGMQALRRLQDEVLAAGAEAHQLAVEQGCECLLGTQEGALQLHLDRIVQAWVE